MKIESVPIDSLHPDPANVRRHPERNLQAIRSSLARFGQQRPIVVDRKGVVRAGNGTLEAARQLEWTHVKVVRTDLEGSEATAYAIADNRSSELAEFDQAALAETLEALRGEGFDLDAVGFTGDEVDALLGNLGDVVDDPDAEWDGMPEFEHEDQESKFKAYVHFRNEDDIADFERIVGQKIPRDRWAIWHPKAEIERYADKRYAADEAEGDGA